MRPGASSAWSFRLGYSFNLDGTNIYMTLAALFIAQAFNIDLTHRRRFTRFSLVAMHQLEGRGRGDWRGLHHARRDARDRARRFRSRAWR